MLDFENNENPNEMIRTVIAEWKSLSKVDVSESEQVLSMAEDIKQLGIDNKDALHIACAIQGNADVFFTTDNSIIKRREKISKIRILNPVYLFTDAEYTEE
jgi:predicted nucleic acid-binding protein